MNVSLMADIKEDFVAGGVKDPMEGDAQFHDAQIRPEVTAGFRKSPDQLGADLFGKLGKILFAQFL